MTERGCAWRCSFCAEWRGELVRPLADVVAEIDEARALGYGALFFEDSTFLHGFGDPPGKHGTGGEARRRSFVAGLLDHLRTTGLEWGCQTRVDTITEEVASAGSAPPAAPTSTSAASRPATCSSRTWAKRRVRAADGIAAAAGDGPPGGHPDRPFHALRRPEPRRPRAGRWRTSATIDDTIQFFAREVTKGGIVTVSRNVMAYYPGAITTARAGAGRGASTPSGAASPTPRGEAIPWPGWNRFEDGRAASHAAKT